MAREHTSSILRALQILECFMDQEKEWTLKELVNQLGLPTTTVFRHVSTLMERRYLTQDPVRKTYHVGPNLLALAGAIIGGSDLCKIARPELERLSDRVKETINLSILVDNEIFYLDKVETQRSITCSTSRRPCGRARDQLRQDPACGQGRRFSRTVLRMDEKRSAAHAQDHHTARPAAEGAGIGAHQRLRHGRRRGRAGTDLCGGARA